ncbi:hypothetical protein [Legionella gresilensis]|uniref:hypothetical protein n=1 Tax=Legionella gresilensis TaxID=91823 RepID=UPI001040F7DC|nr:hypothetical protein [Legionella gresilensis]
MDVTVPQVKMLHLKQLLERWPHYSLDNIYDLANQGYFGLYVKSLAKKKVTYHINPYLDKLIGAAKKRYDELQGYINQKKEIISYFSERSYLLNSLKGFDRLATKTETELFPLTQTSSVKDLIEFNRINYLDFNNTFGFQGPLSDPHANSYLLAQQTSATHQLPQDYKSHFTEKDVYVLLDQIEHFELTEVYKKTYSKSSYKNSNEHPNQALSFVINNDVKDSILTSSDNPSAVKEYQNLFIKSDSYYEIHYINHKTIIKASKGLIYIENLVKNPGRDFHVNDLEKLINKPPHSEVANLIDLNESNTHVEVHSSQKMIDKKAILAIKNKIAELNDKIELEKEILNREEIERLEEIRQFYLDYLSNSSIKSMPKNFNKPTEKVRKRVFLNIRNAIKTININNPLHMHLIKSIKTGEFCVYKPDKDTNWIFSYPT